VYRELADTDPDIEVIAGSIIMGQSQDVGRMVQMLRFFGEPEAAALDEPRMGWMGMSVPADEMPGLASEAELDELATSSGSAADALFAELMIAHHEGGIHMADEAALRADRADVRLLAERMATNQRGEILDLRDALARAQG
jgi:uncharacterized protein (DUF305 family)